MNKQVGSQDSDEAKMRVVNQMLSAVRSACESCVKQERETRDSIVAHINTAKVVTGAGRMLSVTWSRPKCNEGC